MRHRAPAARLLARSARGGLAPVTATGTRAGHEQARFVPLNDILDADTSGNLRKLAKCELGGVKVCPASLVRGALVTRCP